MSANKMKVCFFKRKPIVIGIFIILILITVLAVYPRLLQAISVLTGGSADNWGLSFQTEGAAPTGNATQEFLSGYDAYYLGDTTEKTIYLTFDAGFENGYTEQILDTLKKHQVPAAFFLVGTYIRDNPDLVKRMVDDGHIVGNHTNTHPDMSEISTEASFSEELKATEEYFKQVTNQEMPKFYRPPQGKYSEQNLAMAQSMGYKTIFWSLAYVDWYADDQPSAEEAFSKLLPRIHNGAIVLLHSTSATNAEILDELLTKWEEAGYSFKSLNDLPSGNSSIVNNDQNPENSNSQSEPNDSFNPLFPTQPNNS